LPSNAPQQIVSIGSGCHLVAFNRQGNKGRNMQTDKVKKGRRVEKGSNKTEKEKGKEEGNKYKC
jgi:hypothetical protein